VNDTETIFAEYDDNSIDFNFHQEDDILQLKENLLPQISNTPNLFYINPLKNNQIEINSVFKTADISCDFSESSEAENFLINPPKIENRCNLINYQEALDNHITDYSLPEIINEEIIDETDRNFNKNIVEYELLDTEKYNFTGNIDRDKSDYFIQAKDDFLYFFIYHLIEVLFLLINNSKV
jgi:hypothetical protein